MYRGKSPLNTLESESRLNILIFNDEYGVVEINEIIAEDPAKGSQRRNG